MDDLTNEEEKILEEGIIYSKKKALLEDLKDLEKSLPEVEIVPKKSAKSKEEKWIIVLLVLLVIFAILGYWFRGLAEQPVTLTPPHLIAFNQHFQPYPTLGLVRNNDTASLRAQALEAYSRQDFTEAIVKFESLIKENPNPQTQDELLNMFFLGIAYVGSGQADQGIEQLKRFQELAPVLDDQAEWYVAMAYLQKGDLNEIRRIRASITNKEQLKKIDEILTLISIK